MYLSAKFEVSSITRTGFGQEGGGVIPPLTQHQNEPLKSPPRLGLSKNARSSKAYSSSSKHICPSNICPNRSACLSNICLNKPARATTGFPSTPTYPPNLRLLK